MQKYFDQDLGVNILYKEPLFIVELDLKDNTDDKKDTDKEIQGGKRFHKKQYTMNKSTIVPVTVQFMNALHHTTDNAHIILRSIILFEDIKTIDLKKHNSHPLNNTAKFIFGEHKIIEFPFSIGNGLGSVNNEYIIILEYNEVEDANDFLSMWKNFYYEWQSSELEYHSKQKINDRLENHKIIGSYTPSSKNPECVTYYLCKKK